jgi:hypothetical protein
MNLGPKLVPPRKSLLAALLVVAMAALAIGWTAGTVAASSGPRAASTTPVATSQGAIDHGAPGIGITTTTPQTGAGTTSSGAAGPAAYPVPGYNSLGVAPQGTILAEGTGTAAMKADGSDKAAALKTATNAALADAHAQALAAAASMGVQLHEIYSLSIASNPNYIYPTPDCVYSPPVPGSNGATGSAGTTLASPPAICPQVQASGATSAQMVVTVIVAYKYS